MKSGLLLRSIPVFLTLCCAIAIFTSETAAAQTFTINPSSIAFKSTVVGMETAVTEITITNTGTSNLVVTNFSITPFNVFVLEYGWTRTLHKGQAGIWAVRFKPQAAGAVTGQISFTIQGVSQPLERELLRGRSRASLQTLRIFRRLRWEARARKPLP
jgi:hypothetical protein